MFRRILRVSTFVAGLLAVFIAQSTGFAEEGPTRVTAGGEAIAAAFVQYVGHDGFVRNVPSVGTIGNRITFGFNARKDKNGEVEGQMQLVDHASGLVVHSDVVEFIVHPTHNRPVGSTGPSARRMRSSTQGVTVNGESRFGWRFVNSPVFDGGQGVLGTGDTICFELFDQDGRLVLQWSAFLSSGNVRIVD